MLQPDINVIRAVHDGRIRRDPAARHRAALPRRSSVVMALRRSIGRSIVRLGARVAAEPTGDGTIRLAGLR